MKEVTSKKHKDRMDNESKKFHSYLHSVISSFNITIYDNNYENIPD